MPIGDKTGDSSSVVANKHCKHAQKHHKSSFFANDWSVTTSFFTKYDFFVIFLRYFYIDVKEQHISSEANFFSQI